MASENNKTSTRANSKKSTSKTTEAKKSTTRAKASSSNTSKTASSRSKNTSTTEKKTSAKKAAAADAAPKADTKKKIRELSPAETEKLAEKNKMFKNEIVILASAAVSLFLFCSNLHWCGSIGEFVHRLQCGSMGALGYFFPIYLTVVVALVLMRRGSFNPQLKVVAALIMYWAFCGVVELLFGGGFDRSLRLMDYYKKGISSVGGGIFGGMISMALVPGVSFVGAFILMLVVILIAIVYISEHSIVEPIGKKGKKVYRNAKEDIDKHRVERKQYYEDVKNTENKKYYEQDKAASKQDKDASKQSATINLSDYNKGGIIKGKSKGNSGDNTSDSAFIDIANRKKMRNVNEFVVSVGEEKERKKPVNAPADWYREEPAVPEKHEYVPPKKDEIDDIDVVLDENVELRKPYNYDDDNKNNSLASDSEDVEIIDDDYVDNYSSLLKEDTGRTQDIRRVVTANGKIIEKEIDPTDDPIARKSAKARQEYKTDSDGQYSFDTDNIQTRRSRGTSGERAISAAEFEALNKKPVKKTKPYVKPPIRLLQRQTKTTSGMTKEVLNSTALKLQQTLRDFGVGVTVTDYSCGPAVTRYELQPDQGVKVSKIVALADDIKLNLAAADIRIEAPIPGKSVVGIEVPNKENSTVYFRNVIESDEFCNHPSKLAFAVGKDIGGNNIVADLSRMPHLLIAGATGSGKSVCINTLIMSILYKSTPEEVQLLMIDPKVVELSVYNGIPHLKYPVVTDPKMASGTLNWAVAEMTDRYKKFAEHNVRDIKGYNEKVEELKASGEDVSKLPQIVIIVDELADLMMVAPGEVEDAICRLAQMARAAGLHLVIATQRPSVNVITGLIKANVPSRIAFAVSSGVDSRTIIDMNGAEKLLGKGDMLFYPSGYSKPIRVQGAFVSDKEVSEVVEFLSGNSEPVYDENIKEAINKFSNGSAKNAQTGGSSSDSMFDEYFERAGRFIVEKDKASIGMLQRMFKIGFNRAGRIMDQLAEAGVVGEEEGTKPRKVLMSMEQFEAFIEDYL